MLDLVPPVCSNLSHFYGVGAPDVRLSQRLEMKPSRATVGEKINAGQAAAAAAYGSAVRPILYYDRTGEPELTGSCVLMRIGQRHFALTAAHVTDALVQRGHILVGGTETIVEPAPRAFGSEIPVGGSRDDDLVDLAFLEFTDAQAADLGDCVWLSPQDVEWERVPPGAEVPYLALGYPWRKSRFRRSAARVDAVPLAYGGALANHEVYAATGYDPETHVVIHFNRERAVTKAGWGVPMVKPHGMSGGGLWRFNSVFGGSPRERDRLAGILIAWHWGSLKVMVATRAHLAMVMMCQIYPELQPLVVQA